MAVPLRIYYSLTHISTVCWFYPPGLYSHRG